MFEYRNNLSDPPSLKRNFFCNFFDLKYKYQDHIASHPNEVNDVEIEGKTGLYHINILGI